MYLVIMNNPVYTRPSIIAAPWAFLLSFADILSNNVQKDLNCKNSRVPAGKGHHDIEGGQGEDEVEEAVGVGDGVLFVVVNPLTGITLHISRVGGFT